MNTHNIKCLPYDCNKHAWKHKRFNKINKSWQPESLLQVWQSLSVHLNPLQRKATRQPLPIPGPLLLLQGPVELPPGAINRTTGSLPQQSISDSLCTHQRMLGNLKKFMEKYINWYSPLTAENSKIIIYSRVSDLYLSDIFKRWEDLASMPSTILWRFSKQYNSTLMGMNSETWLPPLEAQFHHLVSVWSRAIHLTSQYLSFLICQTTITTVPRKVTSKMKELVEVLEQSLMCGKHLHKMSVMMIIWKIQSQTDRQYPWSV